MNAKRSFCFYIIAFLPLLCRLPPAVAVTIDELASICAAIESGIVDISLEYEWYNIPPWTVEEGEKQMGIEMLVPKEGVRKFKFSAAGLLSNRDPNGPSSPLPERLLLETSTTIMDEDGNTWDTVLKSSYNGKIAKYLDISGQSPDVPSGGISHKKRFMLHMNLTPLGFSAFRLSFSKVTENTALSALLRYKEIVRLDNNLREVNGFNTIRVDFLQEWTKQVCMRVYFSVNHGYTPVMYEFIRGGKPGFEQVDFAVEVHSLELVSEGLWFPNSGLIRTTDRERVDVYLSTSKILVNQGLTEEYFDIDFPVGTKVRDEIKGIEYIVKPK